MLFVLGACPCNHHQQQQSWRTPSLKESNEDDSNEQSFDDLSSTSFCLVIFTRGDLLTIGTFVNGNVRVSGEDHFSACKESNCQERCSNLIQWIFDRYRIAHSDKNEIDAGKIYSHMNHGLIPQQYGIYSETPDFVPLVGSTSDNIYEPTFCFFAGSNAWGEAILSYLASVVPAQLGYRPWTECEQDIYDI